MQREDAAPVIFYKYNSSIGSCLASNRIGWGLSFYIDICLSVKV